MLRTNGKRSAQATRIAVMTGLALAVAVNATAVTFHSYTPLFEGPVADFDAFADGDLISDQYAAITFSQPDHGRPQVDQFDWLFGYGASSGTCVLVASTEGGAAFPTIAGITFTFATPQAIVQFLLSDTDALPRAEYPVTAYNGSGEVLESFSIPGREVLPADYAGEPKPVPGTFPLPGSYAGFIRAEGDIKSVTVGPSTQRNDAFSIDDVLLPQLTAPPLPIPEPRTVALYGAGLSSLPLLRKLRI